MKSVFTIEYDMNNASNHVLWNSIGTPIGLALWFSDGVTVDRNEFTFTWEDGEESAILQQIIQGKSIRFQWAEDAGTEFYFEIEIITHELSHETSLKITDFAEEAEMEDAILLWNKQVEIMKRKNGI